VPELWTLGGIARITNMKTLLTLLISLFVLAEAHARIHRFWSYDALNTNATLVVVATPTNVSETSEVAALPDIVTVHSDGTKEPVMGSGVETTFQILTVLKGESTTKTLVLHHYKEVKKEGELGDYGGPQLVSFEPKDKKRYLMYLQKEADGRYVAVSGQTDPVDAIKQISDNYP
jgi:hypothetical protein